MPGILAAAHLEQVLVGIRCLQCGAQATLGEGQAGPFDPVSERGHMPEVECFLTPGCQGRLIPEPLN